MAKGANKKAKSDRAPIVGKSPRHTKDPEGYQHQLIGWHLQCMDDGGEWACTIQNITSILDRLHEYERKKWHEILNDRSNHPMPCERICRGAQRRLDQIGFENTANLYQLRIHGGGGRQRLWGIRKENIFQILWWDPNHTVYPLAY
jgi:hypothetical protein